MSSELQPAKWRFSVALAGVVLVHLILLLYFAPPGLMFSKEPVLTVDYALHAYQVDRAYIAFTKHGALWAWDPLQLAGQPAGVVEDLTSKGTELFVIGLGYFGVARAFAFNLFIVLVHLGLPLSVWLVGRLVRFDRWETLTLYCLWLGLWFFDSFLHWSWWIGMITWAFASYASVLLVALLYRCLEEPKWSRFVWLGVLASLIAIVHPFAALSLLAPCAVLYARAFKGMGKGQHLALGLAALAALSTMFVWIFPFLRFKHYVGDVDTFFNATPSFAFFDSFDLLKDGRQTGGPVRTLVRTLCFVAAGIQLYRWHRSGDRRALPFSVLVGGALVLAYFSAYSWHGRQTQPYRNVGPAMLGAAVPAAVLLRSVFSVTALRGYPRQAQLALLCLLVVAAPRFVRTVLQYVPSALPTQVERTDSDRLSSPMVGLNEPGPLLMRHQTAPAFHQGLRRWLVKHHREGQGRVVVNDWVLGEYLAASTNIPILGGIPERNVPHVDANLFRREPNGDLPEDQLAQYLREYAVEYLVLAGASLPLERNRKLVTPIEVVSGYRVYRTKAPASYFAAGGGEVTRQRINSIQIAHATGDAVVLRFHWMETLKCRPNCEVERERVAIDRVGFIRVKHPPKDFEIYNGY